jgi:hypothetical protein
MKIKIPVVKTTRTSFLCRGNGNGHHTHTRFIEMPQQCHEKVRSCMCVRGHVCVLGVSNERLVLRFFD